MVTINKGQVYLSGRQKYQRPQALLFSDNPGIPVNPLDLSLGYYPVPNNYEIGSDALSNQEFIILSDDNRSPVDISTQRIEKRERMINGRMRSYHVADKINVNLSWDMLPSRAYSSLADFNAGQTFIVTAQSVSDGNTTITVGTHNFVIGDKISLVHVDVTSLDEEGMDVTITNVPIIGVTSTQIKFATIIPAIVITNNTTYVEISLPIGSSSLPKSEEYTTDGGAGGVELLDWYETHTGPFYVFLAYDKYNNFSSDKYSQLTSYNQVVEMYISNFSYTIEKRGIYDYWNVSISLEEV